MVAKVGQKGIGIWTWLAIVGFLLIFPPGLPVALTTDRPVVWGLIAVGFALIGGSMVWLISYQASKSEERSVTGSDSDS